jgi:hypothetical protein
LSSAPDQDTAACNSLDLNSERATPGCPLRFVVLDRK